MKTVGRYEILRELGRGGMALVYLARQNDLDRFVALKELGAFHASDASFAQRFIRESRVAGSLSHPNIVTVHDYFEHEGTPYIAMEYVERGSLRPYIGKTDLPQVAGILEGLLAGLAAAEQQGIVHRDLKPENLMVTSDGRVKIADFGIAKATTRMQTGAFLTATGTTVGTPTYMAPEQAMAQDVGPWTDLYSVGCMAYEMFTGKVPFHDSEAPMAILLRHVNEQMAPAKEVSDTDPEISDWIEAMVVKDPKARTQSATQAWEDFEEIIISKLGPRWRRGARLTETPGESGPGVSTMTPKPLTPAPFEGAPDGSASADDEFQSFAWGQAAPAPAADTPPGPVTPPPSEAAPAPPEAPAAPVAPAAEDDGGFETYIAPAPAKPPTNDSPLAAPPPDPAPPAPTPAPAAPPPAPAPPAPAPPPAPPAASPPPAPAPPVPPAPAPPTPEPPAAAPAPPPTPAPAPPPQPVAASAAPPADPGATIMPEALRDKPGKDARIKEAPPAKKPPAARQPDERKPEPAGGRSVLPIAVGVAVVLAIAGFVAGGSGGGSGDSASGGTPVKSGTVQLSAPEGWSKADAPQIAGLALEDPVAVASGGKGVVAGKAPADAANFTLLPNALLSAVGGPPDARPAVLLPSGEVQAYRYEGLKPEGGDELTVFAAQTSSGVINVACYGGVAAEECDSVAGTLKVLGGSPLPVGPDEAFGKEIDGLLGKLAKGTGTGRKDLAAAKTGKAQASAAGKVAAAYNAAGKDLSAIEANPADAGLVKVLGAALADATKAWKALGSAASKGSKDAYSKAQGQVQKAEKGVSGALAAFEAAGYTTDA